MNIKKRALTVLLLLAALFNLKAENENLKKWFLDDKHALRYGEIEGELHTLFDSLTDQNIPPSLLMDKLKEGVSKGVPSFRLIAGIEGEAERLKTAKKLLTPKFIEKEKEFILLKGLSLFLLNGLTEEQLDRFIQSDLPEVERLLLLGAILLDIKSLSPLTDREIEVLGTSLLKSQFPSSSYPALSSLFLKGKSRRVPQNQIISIITSVLEQGGGLVQINREFNRRLK